MPGVLGGGHLQGPRRSARHLTLRALRLLDDLRAPLFVYENVTGILSDGMGAFASLLAGLCGGEEALPKPRNRKGRSIPWPTAGVAGKPAPFAGEGRLSGPIPSTLTELLHSGPVPRRYHLSDTAALGITTRALRRGKGLPPLMAAAAAERVAVNTTALLTTVRSKKKNRAGRMGVALRRVAAVYDARCNGTGDVAGTITGDHDSRVTDYTKIRIGVDPAVAPGVGDVAAMTLDKLARVAQAQVAAVGRRYTLRRFS